MVGLGSDNAANAISPNGSIIAGSTSRFGQPGPSFAAFWTEGSNNWTSIGEPISGGGYSNSADGIADNGTLIINSSTSRFVPPELWSPDTGYTDLGAVSGSTQANIAYDISADGRVVVGFEDGTCDHCQQAWIWDDADGKRYIADLLAAEGIDTSNWTDLKAATSVSADGSLIVGPGLGTDGEVHGWLLNMAPVPLPPALYLFGSGLLGMIGVAREKKWCS